MPSSPPIPHAPTRKLHAFTLASDDLRDIIANPARITLVAQPIVDLRRGVIVGYEALSRFTLASGRAAFPEEVFAAAIRTGLGPQLEASIIRRGLQLAEHRPPNCFLTINVDPLDLVSDDVLEVIGRHGDLAGIIFELTEHNSVEDVEQLRHAVDLLRRHGAMIALDDAGAGYSGLKKIIELQPQFIKIDRDLITGVHMNEAKRTLIHMLGELAGRLDAWIIAEGIETVPELNAIAQLQVPLGQGYVLGRPAAPWSNLASEANDALATIAQRRISMAQPAPIAKIGGRRPSLISDLVDQVATCRGDEEWPAGAVAVRVDRGGRPLEMRLADDDGTRFRMEYDLLRVKSDTTVAEAAHRATTREGRLRWDPLLCIDDLGNLIGLVSMTRVVSALAQDGTRARDDASASSTVVPQRARASSERHARR